MSELIYANYPAALTAPLNQPTAALRLARLREYAERFRAREFAPPTQTDYVNNHIHTIYSFSPYSPADAAYRAWLNGLATAGIMDHDSVSGAEEFLEAGRILGIGATVGFECRCSLAGTPYSGRRLNNPDQEGVAYVACHGIPASRIHTVDRWLAPYRAKREERNRRMVERINALTGGGALELDYERDVATLSQSKHGGSVTERHLLYALTLKLLASAERGKAIVTLLKDKLAVDVTGKNRMMLLDASDIYYDYRLLGVLKSELVPNIYIDADAECPPLQEFVEFARSIGAIPAYPYLGDVSDSVTGDKKAQAFEDAFIDELIPWLGGVGFLAVTYMPTRNTLPQLERLMGLCRDNDLFQISGEDINTPFQRFVCERLAEREFRHLIDSAWALIGHERVSDRDQEAGMFSAKSVAAEPLLNKRIEGFAYLGRLGGGGAPS
ncbi:MAG: PHP domain-containing protein [Oscillospiraceae bacterium]|jgi:hypothetical protein|nr:PHP domain-containing protein [Oscillospiraceae bacterium]